MSSKNTMTMNLGKLDDLRGKLAKGYSARIGILNNLKYPDGTSVALVGTVQEFGSITNNIPPRSFLRMPLTEKRKELLKDIGKSQGIAKFIDSGNIEKLFQTIGAIGVGIVQQAFETKGFGKWAANKPQTAKRKGSDSPLIDTGLLRKSVTFDVVKK